jgi:transposase InsO family protein
MLSRRAATAPRGCTRSCAAAAARMGRKRVARLMRASGLQGRVPKRWRKTTVAGPATAARTDKIRRDFGADAGKVNIRWCGDITYVATWEGWLYLATVIDIASRREPLTWLSGDPPVTVVYRCRPSITVC